MTKRRNRAAAAESAVRQKNVFSLSLSLYFFAPSSVPTIATTCQYLAAQRSAHTVSPTDIAPSLNLWCCLVVWVFVLFGRRRRQLREKRRQERERKADDRARRPPLSPADGKKKPKQTQNNDTQRPGRALVEARRHHAVEQLHPVLELRRGHAHGRGRLRRLLAGLRLRGRLRLRRRADDRLAEHCSAPFLSFFLFCVAAGTGAGAGVVLLYDGLFEDSSRGDAARALSTRREGAPPAAALRSVARLVLSLSLSLSHKSKVGERTTAGRARWRSGRSRVACEGVIGGDRFERNGGRERGGRAETKGLRACVWKRVLFRVVDHTVINDVLIEYS
jgi:hypothetical protein